MSSDLDIFYSSLACRLGIRLDEHNADKFEQALTLRLRSTGADSVEAYLRRCGDPDFARKELREIAGDLTVAETYFFRHPEHFQVLAELALPERLEARQANRRLAVLSAGCAGGEETYSLAVTLKPLVPPDWDIRISGIDVNPRLLNKAVRGIYTDWSLRTMAAQERLRYFRPWGASEYALNEDLRRMVTFEERNLIDEGPDFWQVDSFDIVFCRNVLMYFSPAAARDFVNRLIRSLCPGGYLFLSPSETLRGITQEFHLRHTHGAFYYQRRYPGEGVPAGWISSRPESRGDISTIVPPDQDMYWADTVERAHTRIHALARRAKRNSGPPVSRKAQVEGSPSPPQGLDSVRQLLHQERFIEALRTLDELPRAAPDADTLLLQAVLLTQTAEVERARETCRQLLELDELNAGAHYLTAVCLEHSGDYLGAAEHDQTAAYLDPGFAMPHLHLGLLARRMGDSTTARRELTCALELLAREDASRILLFGGGFNREALARYCESQLRRCGATP